MAKQFKSGTELIEAISDAAILARVMLPDDDQLSPAAAEALLHTRFNQRDLDRIQELLTKDQEDQLTPSEQAELETYRRVSFLLDLMHAKARRAMEQPQAVH